MMAARRLRSFVGLLFAIVLVGSLGACASQSSESAAGSAASDKGSSKNVIGGVPVASLGDAKHDLAFAPFFPQGLGETVLIYQTDPETPDQKTHVIEFDFPESPFGPVRVVEFYPQFPATEWPKMIDDVLATIGKEDTHGYAEERTIRGDRSALLTVAEDRSTSTVRWYESDTLEVTVNGDALSPDEALKIASSI